MVGWNQFALTRRLICLAGLQYDFYNATIHDVDFAEDGITATDHGPKTMTGVHQAQFLADFTIEQATKAGRADKPFFIHTTPVMPHWGTCIGPDPPAPGYPSYDPHWEFALTDPLTGRQAQLPISPCPSHKHRHDFDGQSNRHIASCALTVYQAFELPLLEHHAADDHC